MHNLFKTKNKIQNKNKAIAHPGLSIPIDSKMKNLFFVTSPQAVGELSSLFRNNC